MLQAVQQMVDALSALSITHKLLATMEQQTCPQTGRPAQHQLQAGASARGLTGDSSTNSSSGGGSGDGGSGQDRSRSAVECVQWQQELLLQELVQPIHGSLCRLLQELRELVGLVVTHIRSHSTATRAALLDKIQGVHSLRVSVSLDYIHLRNQRHRKMRQQLAALRHSTQQQQMKAGSLPHHMERQQQQPAVGALPDVGQQRQPGSSAAAAAGAAASSARQAATAAAGPAASPLVTDGVTAQYSSHATVGPQAVQPSEGAPASTAAAGTAPPAAVGGEGWCSHPPGFQQQVLSTVQYMAFVHALRRFFDRAVAVARCAADAQF